MFWLVPFDSEGVPHPYIKVWLITLTRAAGTKLLRFPVNVWLSHAHNMHFHALLITSTYCNTVFATLGVYEIHLFLKWMSPLNLKYSIVIVITFFIIIIILSITKCTTEFDWRAISKYLYMLIRIKTMSYKGQIIYKPSSRKEWKSWVWIKNM